MLLNSSKALEYCNFSVMTFLNWVMNYYVPVDETLQIMKRRIKNSTFKVLPYLEEMLFDFKTSTLFTFQNSGDKL